MVKAFSIIAALLGLTLFMGITWIGCSAYLKSKGPYREAMAIATSDSTVNAALGPPARAGFLINGEIVNDGIDQWATYISRISGSSTRGTLRIRGYRAGDRWQVVRMTLETRGNQRFTYTPETGFVRGNGPQPIGGPYPPSQSGRPATF